MADQPIATTAEITGVRLQVQSGDPSSGYDSGGAHDHGVVYSKAGGVYYRMPDGTVIGPFAAGAGLPLIELQEQQTSGTDGGTFTSGSWVTRTLNTEVVDTGSNCTLSGNQFTLAAGTYRIHWSAPAFKCDQHHTRLQNVTDSATVLNGTSEYANATNSIGNRSFGEGRFTIGTAKALEIQHQCATTQATNGLGVKSSLASTGEVYTTVWIERES